MHATIAAASKTPEKYQGALLFLRHYDLPMPCKLPSLSEQTAQLLLTDAVLSLRSRWSVLKASGDRVRDYLQGQITQDIKRLSRDRGIHCCLLSPQGKAVSELYILEGNNNELILLAPASHAETAVARLRRFAVGFDLRIGIVSDLAIASIQGAHAHALLDSFGLPEPAEGWLSTSRDAERFALVMPEQPRGFWVIANRNQLESVASNRHLIDESEIEAMRIIRGIPDFGTDWDETIHPLNANLIEFDGVSFEKGCYVGQEVTSRMHWRGGIKKRLYRISIDGRPEAVPCALCTTASIGTLKSAAIDHEKSCVGIAHLPIAIAESEAALTLENGARVEIVEACHA